MIGSCWRKVYPNHQLSPRICEHARSHFGSVGRSSFRLFWRSSKNFPAASVDLDLKTGSRSRSSGPAEKKSSEICFFVLSIWPLGLTDPGMRDCLMTVWVVSFLGPS